MPGSYRARCLVLKKTKLGETDTILTMLERGGTQVRAVAKGLRKPGNRIGARLEPFSVADVLLHQGKSLDIVREARCVATNAPVRESLEKTAAGDVICEFLDKVSRDGAALDARVFPLSETAFSALAQGAPDQAGLFAAAHLFKAMAMQGYRPAFRRCAACGKPLEGFARFDVSAGGALCAACAPGGGTGVDPALANWADTLLRSTFADLGAVGSTAPTRRLLDLAESWCREHLSLNLRAMGFLKTLC